jgi:hypothetical protein
MLKRYVIILLTVFLLSGCRTMKTSDIENYKYGIILSNQQYSGVIQLYDKNGNYLGNKKIKASGIDENGSASLNSPQYFKGKWYIGVSSSLKRQGILLEIDSSNLSIKEIPSNTDKMYEYTGFLIGETNYYTFYSPVGVKAPIIKSDLSTYKKVSERLFDSDFMPLQMIPYKDRFVLVSDKVSYIEISIKLLNCRTLKVEEEYNIRDFSFSQESLVIKDKLYLVPFSGINDSKNNKLIVFDLHSGKWESVNLPFSDLRFLRERDGKLYIANLDLDLNPSSITIVDLDTMAIERTKNFDYPIRDISIDNNNLVTSSDDSVYLYDLHTLKQIKSFEIKTDKNLMFGSLLVRPSN